MTENFDKGFGFVLSAEGGLVDDPKDSGGLTKYGISQRAYPQTDIRNLTISEAKAIYKSDFWDRCDCDNIQWPLDVVVFDTAVNMGCSMALKLLEKNVEPKDYLLLRIGEYATFKTFPAFGRGWIKRVLRLYKFVEVNNAHS